MKTFAILVLFAIGACSGATDKTPLDQKQQGAASTPSLCQEDDPECVPNPCMPASCCPQSPIVFDMLGNGFDFTDAVHGVTFALSPGEQRPWAWTKAGSDDAWLALDLNHNGVIDDGGELFGNETLQSGSRRDGFHALAQYDKNHDGKIDSSDSDVWGDLLLWTDTNHDGVSQPGELRSLDSAGVHSIGLTATISEYADPSGNEFKLKGSVVADMPVNATISDVWLQPGALPEPQACQTELKCTAWVYIPIGNPFGMRCGVNPGGHGVPVITLTTPGGQIYQAERFTQAVGLTVNTVDTELRREMTDSARDGLRTKLNGLHIGGCVPAPYPVPDPFGVATEPTTSSVPELQGNWSVICTQRPVCGGCSFDGGGSTPQ